MNTEANDSPQVKEDRNCTEAVDYVNQLIARMNGDDEPVGNATEPLLPASDTVEAPPDASKASEPPAVQSDDVADDSARRQQQRPIVMAADLQRLREAVNLSTNRALQSFDTITLFRTVYSYIILAVVLIATSLTLVSMSDQIRSTSYAASVIAVVVATMATWKYIQNVSRLSKTLAKSSRLAREIPAL